MKNQNLYVKKSDRIFLAGHNGLVGRSVLKKLKIGQKEKMNIEVVMEYYQ